MLVALLLIWLMIADYQDGRHIAASVDVAMNVVVNAYPIMLQRHHRARALPLLKRLVQEQPAQAVS